MRPRICSVLIIGGRTGLFSRILSSSNITDTDKRGSNWKEKLVKFLSFSFGKFSHSKKFEVRVWLSEFDNFREIY